jgi:hypothetical protein
LSNNSEESNIKFKKLIKIPPPKINPSEIYGLSNLDNFPIEVTV